MDEAAIEEAADMGIDIEPDCTAPFIFVQHIINQVGQITTYRLELGPRKRSRLEG